MTNAVNKTTFNEIVRVDRMERDLHRVFTLLAGHGIGNATHQLVPTLINLQFARKINQSDALVVRSFLYGLRSFQLSHFVRFCGDLDWFMDADCGDIFYSRSKDSLLHKDAVIKVDVVSNNHIELRISVPTTTKSHLLVHELSRSAWPSIAGVDLNDVDDDVSAIMRDYSINSRFLDIVGHTADDCHVLFIPTEDEERCHVIPLFGLTEEDAKRRSYYTDRNFEFIRERYADYVNDLVFTQEICHHLVNEIQLNEQMGNRTVTAAQTYALAEILFGYYLRGYENSKSMQKRGHEFVWFETVEDDKDHSYVETFSIRLSTI